MQLGLALYNALRSVDIPDDEAMNLVNALESEMNQQLATKQDLSQLGTRLTVRMGAMGAGIIGIQSIIMALLKVFD